MRQTILTPMNTQKPSGCGCLGGGCLLGSAVILLILGALAWGAWSTFSGLRSMTSNTPRPIPVYGATADEYKAVAAKMKAFETTYEAGQPAEISLSADEINTWIARAPDASELRGHVFVTMHGTRIAAAVSVPLTQIRAFEKDYFNGEASMSFITEKGQPRPVSVNIKANGSEFPSWLIRYISSKDFIENLDLPNVPKNSGVFSNLMSLEVRDEKLIIRAQKKSDGS